MATIRSKKTQTKSPIAGCSNENDPWESNISTVREFLNKREDYDRLCGEVAYTLRQKLKEKNIQTASVTARAKTLNSFLGKIQRKSYANPLAEITDLAGARVVCLYRDDLEAIENIIREEFEVIEKVDKLNDKQIDQFGYGAIHFIVRLSSNTTGARYDDLRTLECEIQTRTVLQDAWAIIQHHLVYKNERDTPSAIQRRLNGLSGLLETADDQYQQIRIQRDAYLQEVQTSKKTQAKFLKNDLNIDSLRAYLAWKLPNRDIEGWNGQLATIFQDWNKEKYPSLREVDELFNATESTRKEIAKKVLFGGKKNHKDPFAAVELAWAAALVDPSIRTASGMPSDWHEEIIKHINKFPQISSH